MSYGLCYICDEYPPVVETYGGIGITIRELAEAFARKGRRVSVICRTNDRRPGVHWTNGVCVHVVKPSAIPRLRAIIDRLRLSAIVRRVCTTPADIVICTEYAGPFVARGFRNPLVVQLEGAMTVVALEQHRPAGRVARFCERRTVDLADVVAAPSRFCAEVTLSALGARPRAMEMCPTSVDAERFYPAPAEVDPHRVLFVGKLNRLKGLFVLAQAIPRLFAAVPEATLTLMGGDHIEDGQSCLAQFLDALDAPARARVRVLGARPHTEVAYEMRQCGVLVLPSFTEMCPLAILEAMSCGRPVVASNRGGIPELVHDGQTGLLADPDRPETFADALIGVLTDRPTADAMGRAGRRHVLDGYTSARRVDDLERFYDRLSHTRASGSEPAQVHTEPA